MAVFTSDLLHCSSSVVSKLLTSTEQYNLVPAKGVISLPGKVTAGLVESNVSLPTGLCLMSPVG